MASASMPPEFQPSVAMVNDQIRKADVLEAERQIDAALRAYKACFDIALREKIPLFVDQLVHIWMGVGFCYADRNQWTQALHMYSLVETVLRSIVTTRMDHQSPSAQELAESWARYLPRNLHVLAPDSFDPAPGLASMYESMGLAYDNSDQLSQAQQCYENAIKWHTHLKDHAGVGRVWHFIALGSQRREDWENLRIAAEEMLTLAEQRADADALIVACQFLAQASVNQLRILDTLEYLKRAIKAESQTRHLDLEQDQQLLADFKRGFANTLRKYVARSQPDRSQPPPDPARFRPVSELFTQVSFQKSVQRGAPQLLFVVGTRKFDVAAQALRLFHLSPLPINVQTLRQLTRGASQDLPGDVDLCIEWKLFDIAPGKTIARTVVPLEKHRELLELNAEEMRFTVVLEEEKGGLVGKARRELVPGSYEPYLLDWYGIEGVATHLRSSLSQATSEELEMLLDLLERRIYQRGLATGLLTQMGFVYRLAGLFDQASECYLREIKAGLRPDGHPGPGTLTALCNLGTVYKKQRDLERARLSYRLALTLNSNYFEPLVSLPGVLEGFEQRLLCWSRAYRLRPDDLYFGGIAEYICAGRPHAVGEVLWLIQETSQAIDLGQPLADLVVSDPAQGVQSLLLDLPQAAPTAGPRWAGRAGPLVSLGEVTHILAQFASAQLGPPAPGLSVSPRWTISVEEMAEFQKDMSGQMSVTSSPGAMLHLAHDPALTVRVVLKPPNCLVHILQELMIPGVPQPALESLVSDTIPARAEQLLELLNDWVARGVLYQSGGEWHCRA